MQVSQQADASEAGLLPLKILYQLSIDDSNKSMFAYAGTLPILMKLLLNLRETDPLGDPAEMSEVQSTLLCLLVNLSQSQTNSEVMDAFFQNSS